MAVEGGAEAQRPPSLSLPRLTARFLRFGLLAWGGPVAQIAMLRRSLVDEERWISSSRFNRTLAVYQVLPGPEAQELCVFFGTLARGRIGGLLAGLAFMLPGTLLMLALAWFYVEIGIASPLLAAAFAGCQAAVSALIVRGVHRIGARALTDRWLVLIAASAAVASLAGLHFAIPLAIAALAYIAVERGRAGWGGVILVGMVVLAGAFSLSRSGSSAGDGTPAPGGDSQLSAAREAAATDLLATGLQAGALTFGGAYTAIPFVQEAAVTEAGWLTNRQFLDGIALSGVIPAPLIVFATFVGFIAGGPLGAIAITIGIFLPAFAMTLLGHRHLEAAVENERLHAALEGITAGVVGLVVAATLQLAGVAVTSVPAAAIFAGALVTLYALRTALAVPGVMVAAGLVGVLVLAR